MSISLPPEFPWIHEPIWLSLNRRQVRCITSGLGVSSSTSGRRYYLEGHIEEDLSKPVPKSSALQGMITFAKSRCRTSASANAREVKVKVIDLIEKTVCQLRSSRMTVFKDCYAVFVGSAAEGTKIDLPDEFDFVVFLPVLSDKSLFEVSGEAVVRSVSRNGNAVLKTMQKCDMDSDYTYIETEPIREKFVTVMTFMMSRDGKLKFDEVCFSHRAIAFRFIYTMDNDDELAVKIDISFGIFDENATMNNSLIKLPVSPRKPFGEFEYIRSIEQEGVVGFYIMGTSNMVKPTSTFAEVLYMTRITASFNRKNCYRLAKCMISSLLPEYALSKRSEYEECKSRFCSKSVFPSFYLKMIFFHLCEFYDEEQYWMDNQIGNRLIEIFAVYAKCAEEGYINNIFLYPTFENKQMVSLSLRRFDIPTNYGANLGGKPEAMKLVKNFEVLLKSPPFVEPYSAAPFIDIGSVMKEFSQLLCHLKNTGN